jgi:hypothetical protein
MARQNLQNAVFESQSAEVATPTTADDSTSIGITKFADEEAGWDTVIPAANDPTRDLGFNADSDIGNFLERPIRQSVQFWPVDQPFYYKFNPWTAYLSNLKIKEKTANYELMRMNLHCKMVVSGTQFHYGRALVSYNPLSGFDQVTVQRNFLDVDLIGASQKPHFFLNPTANTGGVIEMPFFFRENYLSLSKADAVNMGDITIKSFGALQHANDGDDPVTVTIYLWATDIKLHMPTSLAPTVFTSQAGKLGDEYGQGIISKTADSVAKAAGMLEDVPVIGPYARATEMVAGSVGSVARNMGFSRPSIVTDIVQIKPLPTGNLTNVDASDAVQKLTLDSKAEVTIDPRVTGLGAGDEMSIKDIGMKESYLTTFNWNTLNTTDQLLFQSRVSPELYGTNALEIHPTPMSLLAQYFHKWQGSIKFRFQIVKSAYHKGRLLVRYDPRSHSSNIDYNANYSRVIDISEEEDFEIVVGWGQNKPWLATSILDSTTVNFSNVLPRLTTDSSNEFNGILELNVVNQLVCPAPDKDISINVYVSACDDMKWADPKGYNAQELHYFPQPDPPVVLNSQSGVVDQPNEAVSSDTIGSTGDAVDQTMNVFYGESPTSLRELFKRYTYTRTWIPAPGAITALRVSYLTNKDCPPYSGYDPQGIDLDSTGIIPLTITNGHPVNLFLPCYAGYRGAFRKKYFFVGTNGITPSVQRQQYLPIGNGKFVYNDVPLASTPEVKQKFFATRYNRFSNAGAANTNIGINNTIEVELPYYNDGRVSYARLIEYQELNCNSHTIWQPSIVRDTPGQPSDVNDLRNSFEEWSAIGDDFQCYFWTGCPIMYRYVLTEAT